MPRPPIPFKPISDTPWYDVKMATSPAGERIGEVTVYDVIGWDRTASDFYGDLLSLGQLDTLNLRINSPGGSYYDGVAMYTLLKNYDAKKVVSIDGLAASAASLVAMAGDEIVMHRGSMLMIHQPSLWGGGNRQALESMLQEAKGIEDQVVRIYSQRSGMGPEDVMKLLEAETWMTPEEALANGFATQVDDTPVSMTAQFHGADVYRRAPAQFFVPVSLPAAPALESPPCIPESAPGGETPVPITREELTRDNPQLMAELLAEGAQKEAERVKGIRALTIPGYESLVETMLAEPGLSVADASLRLNAAVRQERLAAATMQATVEQATGQAPNPASPDPVSAPPITDAQLAAMPARQRLEHEFKTSPKLQAEYETAEDYWYAMSQVNPALTR